MDWRPLTDARAEGYGRRSSGRIKAGTLTRTYILAMAGPVQLPLPS